MTKDESRPVAADEPTAVEVPHLVQRIRVIWQSWAHQIIAMREDQFLLLLAVLIGVFSGLIVVCFRVALEWTQFVLLKSPLAPGILRAVLAPAITGLVVALLLIQVFPRVRGSRVNQTKAAVYVSNGYIPFSAVIGKFVTCALAIGSGQSLGPEDPSLQMGAGIASAIGRGLHLSREKIRLIGPVGAAAGLAAAFNAPISAVLFVIEEVIGKWSAGVLGVIVLAAVASVVTMRWFLGPESLFRVHPFRLSHPAELLAYVVVGAVGGFASLAFLKWLAYSRPWLQRLPQWTPYLQSAKAGLLIGFIGIKLPQVMGAGYPIIDEALHGEFTWKLLLILAGLKIVATGVSFLSGSSGGCLPRRFLSEPCWAAPSGGIEHLLFPRLIGTVGTFALVGMGTVFAGFLRVPITSIFMVIEVSGSYTAILPVMILSLVAYLISRQFRRTPLFDLLWRQDGLILPSAEEQREQGNVVAEHTVRTDAAIVVDPANSISDVARRADEYSDRPLLLRARAGEWRFLTHEEILRLAADSSSPHTAADAHSKGPMPLIFPDEPLEEALGWAGDWSVLPVVNRADLGKLKGVLTLPDILSAFRKAAKELPGLTRCIRS